MYMCLKQNQLSLKSIENRNHHRLCYIVQEIKHCTSFESHEYSCCIKFRMTLISNDNINTYIFESLEI